MSLLVSGVFGDEMKVFSADDKGTVHLGGNNGTGQDTTTDGNETSERALLICNPKCQYISVNFAIIVMLW